MENDFKEINSMIKGAKRIVLIHELKCLTRTFLEMLDLETVQDISIMYYRGCGEAVEAFRCGDRWICVEIFRAEKITEDDTVIFLTQAYVHLYQAQLAEKKCKQLNVFSLEKCPYMYQLGSAEIKGKEVKVYCEHRESDPTLVCYQGKMFRNEDVLEKYEAEDLPLMLEYGCKNFYVNRNDEYITHTITESCLMKAVYYDADEIAKEKRYIEYNREIKVVVIKHLDNAFACDSIAIYKYLYGEENVYVVEPEKAEFLLKQLMEQIVLLIHDDFFLNSPYMAKYWDTMQRKSSPGRVLLLEEDQDKLAPTECKFVLGRVTDIWAYFDKMSDADTLVSKEKIILESSVVVNRNLINYVDYNGIWEEIGSRGIVSYADWLECISAGDE